MTEYVVKFKVQKMACCGYPPYWITKQLTVEADSEELAREKILNSSNTQIKIDRIDKKQ
jgi:hypothetical protein